MRNCAQIFSLRGYYLSWQVNSKTGFSIWWWCQYHLGWRFHQIFLSFGWLYQMHARKNLWMIISLKYSKDITSAGRQMLKYAQGLWRVSDTFIQSKSWVNQLACQYTRLSLLLASSAFWHTMGGDRAPKLSKHLLAKKNVISTWLWKLVKSKSYQSLVPTQHFSPLFVGDVPLEVLTQIVETISDPSAMLGPEVKFPILFFNISTQKATNRFLASD